MLLRDPLEFGKAVNQHKVTKLVITASALGVLDPAQHPSIQAIQFGGEKVLRRKKRDTHTDTNNYLGFQTIRCAASWKPTLIRPRINRSGHPPCPARASRPPLRSNDVARRLLA